ncbi:MAG: hypothetical protein HW390_3441 [Candidatus Brocadiaceae bacterium]|nr:hypothetical protein [Candidatus Brocadiaceae bacterium]
MVKDFCCCLVPKLQLRNGIALKALLCVIRNLMKKRSKSFRRRRIPKLELGNEK